MESKENITSLTTLLTFPCILEVSQSADFSEDPNVKSNKIQVCIGMLNGKYVCVNSKSEHANWMLDQLDKGIKSGGIQLTLGFWNYARIPLQEKHSFNEWLLKTKV